MRLFIFVVSFFVVVIEGLNDRVDDHRGGRERLAAPRHLSLVTRPLSLVCGGVEGGERQPVAPPAPLPPASRSLSLGTRWSHWLGIGAIGLVAAARQPTAPPV